MPVPVTISRAIICHSRGWPVMTSSPKVPSPSAIMALAATITRCGGSRSATTPPTTVKISDGAICAAST